MRVPVEKSALAEDDLAEIWHYIAMDNTAAAEAWLVEIDEKISSLSDNPRAGRPRDDLLAGLRSFPMGNYLVFYRIHRNHVEVMRVIHGARNLDRVFRR